MGAFLGLAVAIWFIYHAYKASKKDNYTTDIHDDDDNDDDGLNITFMQS